MKEYRLIDGNTSSRLCPKVILASCYHVFTIKFYVTFKKNVRRCFNTQNTPLLRLWPGKKFFVIQEKLGLTGILSYTGTVDSLMLMSCHTRVFAVLLKCCSWSMKYPCHVIARYSCSAVSYVDVCLSGRTLNAEREYTSMSSNYN